MGAAACIAYRGSAAKEVEGEYAGPRRHGRSRRGGGIGLITGG